MGWGGKNVLRCTYCVSREDTNKAQLNTWGSTTLSNWGCPSAWCPAVEICDLHLHTGCQWEPGSPEPAQPGELRPRKESQDPSTLLGPCTPPPLLSGQPSPSQLLRRIPSYRQPLRSWTTAWGTRHSSPPTRPAAPCRWVRTCSCRSLHSLPRLPIPAACFHHFQHSSAWNRLCFICL